MIAFVAQTRDVTVMFCDIVGFTSLCQRVEPQEVSDDAQLTSSGGWET